MISHVRIDIMSREGVLFLGEKHYIQISDEGLLGIPTRLKVNACSLLCFPTKEEAKDTINLSDPFSAICRLCSLAFVVQAKPMLMKTSYSLSADEMA